MSQKAEGTFAERYPRLNELEEFVKHGSRGETLELPYDSAVEMRDEVSALAKSLVGSVDLLRASLASLASERSREEMEIAGIIRAQAALDVFGELTNQDDKGEPPCSNSDRITEK